MKLSRHHFWKKIDFILLRLIAPQTYQKSLAIERLLSLFFDHSSFRGNTPVLLLEVGYIKI